MTLPHHETSLDDTSAGATRDITGLSIYDMNVVSYRRSGHFVELELGGGHIIWLTGDGQPDAVEPHPGTRRVVFIAEAGADLDDIDATCSMWQSTDMTVTFDADLGDTHRYSRITGPGATYVSAFS